MMLTVAIRADASTHIGTGHVMRCLTLAQKIKSRQPTAKITFFTTPHTGNLDRLIQEKGMQLISLPEISNKVCKEDTTSWLGRTQEDDARLCLAKIHTTVDLLIVDHYSLSRTWQHLMRSSCDKIMVIDDLADREHDCDVLLDQTLSRKAEDYKKLTPNSCLILTGAHYTLLREEFSKIRPLAEQKRNSLICLPNNFHVLITMGGFDPENISLVAINALKQLRNIRPNLTASIIISSQSSHLALIKTERNENHWLNLSLDCQSMAAEMLDADIAIGASGATAWERCCLGLPTFSIELAANQKQVSHSLARQGAIINLGSQSTITAAKIADVITAELMHQKDTYASMVQKCFTLCDSKGADRVYNKLIEPKITLRPATIKDIDVIYHWQSNPEIRKFSRNSNPIHYQEHCTWFNKAIVNPKRQILLILQQNIISGMIRFDEISAQEVEISILIDPNQQGKGIALIAVQLASRLQKDKIIHAYVHTDNQPSHKLFKRAKFTKTNANNYRLYPQEMTPDKSKAAMNKDQKT